MRMIIAIATMTTLLASCVAPPVRSREAVQCTFDPEGEDVFVRCSDGSYFTGPANGGPAIGGDIRGHDLYALISFVGGRYSIVVTP
jgi:hypothetical protein